MAALIAVDAREPLMQVTAVEKAFEDLGLCWPVDQPGRIEFIAVSSYTLVWGTYPRVAWAVDTICRRLRVLDLGETMQAEFFLDIFNVLDNQTVMREQDLPGGGAGFDFGDGNGWILPRRFYLGARLSF